MQYEPPKYGHFFSLDSLSSRCSHYVLVLHHDRGRTHSHGATSSCPKTPHTALCFTRKHSSYIEFLNRNCPLVGSFFDIRLTKALNESCEVTLSHFSRLALSHSHALSDVLLDTRLFVQN